MRTRRCVFSTLSIASTASDSFPCAKDPVQAAPREQLYKCLTCNAIWLNALRGANGARLNNPMQHNLGSGKEHNLKANSGGASSKHDKISDRCSSPRAWFRSSHIRIFCAAQTKHQGARAQHQLLPRNRAGQRLAWRASAVCSSSSRSIAA